MSESKIITVAKISIPDGSQYIIVRNVGALLGAIQDDCLGLGYNEPDFKWIKPGMKIDIEFMEMTEAEFDALEEFEGF